MTWNYRVIRHRNDLAERIPAITQAEVIEAGEEFYYQIHECHYAKKGDTVPGSWAVQPSTVGAASLDDLGWVINRMSAAWFMPTLEEVDGKLREITPEGDTDGS